MKSGSKALWGVIVGVLTVALVAVLAVALWPGDEASPSPSGSESVPSAGETTPGDGESTPGDEVSTPGSEPSPGGGDSLDPEDFEGYPPRHPLETVFPEPPFSLPEQVGDWTLDPDMVSEHSLGVSADYADSQGQWLTVDVDMGFLTYGGLVRRMVEPEYVGIAVCGQSEDDIPACTTATEDADIGVQARPGTSFEDMEAFLQALIESY